MFPPIIVAVFSKIKQIANAKIDCRENEIEIHAPDPGEDGEEEAIKQLGILQNKLEELGFKSTPFFRGEKGVDAIRIYIGNNGEGEYMKNEKGVSTAAMDVKGSEQFDSTCQICGNKIEKVPCHVHEEVIELGHRDDCPYKQSIKKECLID